MVSLFHLLANKNEIYPWAVRLGLMWARVSGVLCPWTTLEKELHGSVYTYPLGLVISLCHGKWEGWKRARERPPKMQDLRWVFRLDVIWDARTPYWSTWVHVPALLSNVAFYYCRPWTAQVGGFFLLSWVTWIGFWLQASAWPSLGCCVHVGNEPVEGSSLCLCASNTYTHTYTHTYIITARFKAEFFLI